jgi:hypothetical protein
MEDDVRGELTEFYDKEVRPYLEKEGGKGCAISVRGTAGPMFANLRTLLPEVIHPVVSDLESICEEKRQLDHQIRMHRLLHGWLFIHVPLSLALLVMGAIHAVMALRY